MKPTALERELGLRFKSRELLEQALEHPSYLNEARLDKRASGAYGRLEFLGDAVLGLAITLELFKRFPDLPEGQLTKLRSSLVKGKTLAIVSRGLELGQHIRLGKGEESSGGRDRESNLAATFESLVGAVLLDRGFETAQKFVLRIMREEMQRLLSEGVPEDPKSRLQELVQSMKGMHPSYRLVEAAGHDHARSFDVEVVLDGQVMGRGRATRKADAEMRAAEEALQRLSTTAGP